MPLIEHTGSRNESSSFEIFVRPFISKPIWPPAPARPAIPEDTPEQGVAVLRGLGGTLIDLAFSTTHSWSKSAPVEIKRHVARERIYQKEPGAPGGQGVNGILPPGVNPENYVDVDRVKKLFMQEGDGTETKMHFAEPKADDPERDNIEVIVPEKVIPNPVVPQKIDVYDPASR